VPKKPKLTPEVVAQSAGDAVEIARIFTAMLASIPPDARNTHTLQAAALLTGSLVAASGGYDTKTTGPILRHAHNVIAERTVRDCVQHQLKASA